MFEGTRVQRAADKINPYIGLEGILVRPWELVFRNDSEEEEEMPPRPVRERRPPVRYGEEG